MDFLINSLRPWNNTPVTRRKSSMFGLPIERSMSSMSGVVPTSGNSPGDVGAEFSRGNSTGMDIEQPYPLQRFPSIDEIFRLPSFECIRRMSSVEGIRRLASLESLQDVTMESDFDARRQSVPQLQPVGMEGLGVINDVDNLDSESDINDDHFDYTTLDQSVDATRSATEEIPEPVRRRARCDSVSSTKGVFEVLDQSRPWEEEDVNVLNTYPEEYKVEKKDYNLALGDLRVLARFHVQKEANDRGIKLAAGMTKHDLIALADSLGIYPLIYRLHLEASGRIPLTQIHELFLDYKRESKSRAKSNKAKRDMSLAAKTHINPDGKITIDYFEGIALRLGRERDTIFRPLLHKVFREYKTEIRPRLAEAGLAYNEMRKWRDTQLCTALWVANQFDEGIWQAAVDVHLSKTKDFA